MALPTHAFDLYISIIVMGLEAAAAFIIALGGARALWRFIHSFRLEDGEANEHRRKTQRRLGRALLIALDLTIGADVLKVAQAPNLDRVLVIGLVVLVRVLLTFAVEYELRQEGKEEERARKRERAA